MNHKTFDHGTYRKDDKAKMQIMKWMSQQGYSEVRTNPDQYAIDVLASWYGEPVAFEVEVKHNWRGEEFPFSTCHFSARKRKFLDPLMRVRFAMLNHDRDRFVMFKGEDLLVQGRIVKKNTIYTSDEEFIEIDSRWGQVFDL